MTTFAPRPFYEYLREERQFAFVLAHLLMQNGDALRRFVTMVNEITPEAERWDVSGSLEETEVYAEFAMLRDQWHALGPDRTPNEKVSRNEANAAKREFIDSLLRRVSGLESIAVETKPDAPAEFNAFFMGGAGEKIKRDIASPALWPVSGLASRFKSQPDQFKMLCMVKWAFRIKPDIVLMRPRSHPICIEAKVESGQGFYPSGNDAKEVDRVMNKVTRVSQFDLQGFMFETLLGLPTNTIVIQTKPPADADTYRALTWKTVFTALAEDDGYATSIPFVRRLIESNPFLGKA